MDPMRMDVEEISPIRDGHCGDSPKSRDLPKGWSLMGAKFPDFNLNVEVFLHTHTHTLVTEVTRQKKGKKTNILLIQRNRWSWVNMDMFFTTTKTGQVAVSTSFSAPVMASRIRCSSVGFEQCDVYKDSNCIMLLCSSKPAVSPFKIASKTVTRTLINVRFVNQP